MIKCKYCSKEFEPKNPKGKFCSDKCRVYASRIDKRKKTAIDYVPPPIIISDEKINRYVLDEVGKIEPSQKPTTLAELKILCPENLIGFDRSQWIATKRQEYGI